MSRPAARPTGNGHSEISAHRLGELFVPRTRAQQTLWRRQVRKGLGAFLTIGEHLGVERDEMDALIEMVGFRDMYDLADKGALA